MSPRSPGPLVSIVVPVLDEAATLPGLLDHLAELHGRFEVVVADGGSSDASADVADAHPIAPRVVTAEAAGGEAFVFLHADTRLPHDAYASLCAALRDFDVVGGNFALRFGGADRFSRVLGTWYAGQRRLGIYYVDSVIWARRRVFDALGGYRDLAIMDDYDFVRRLERRGRTACLPGPAVTSARRWQRIGLSRTIASWVLIRWLYLAGVPAARLAGLYRHAR
jgi:glycosyltransferase involved in cell wall biosynthesis